ncbi:signal peptide peptidase SppA [Idiomarina xiamenensis]|uniref:Serine protease n=1 Tax=Idiomarina xiamenensis 10-D-4 TaxID=740709 RepID=K2KWU0_9GAMM|nr:signal peptide peptidase SppA [Idiomarina xiamenensis]EKE86964.1 serine protease [Idiomarina xiamenensis 10-D-4]
MRVISSFFKFLWAIINGARRLIVNLVFFAVLAIVLVLIFSEEEPLTVPDSSILVLNPVGIIVDEETWVDPVEKAFGQALGAEDETPEVLLSDLVNAINRARDDDRIGAIYLNLENLMGGGISKLQRIGAALDQFRTSGKPIIAHGDNFSQTQYYLASYADDLSLNPLGMVEFNGFNYTQLYFKELLDKLHIKPYIFKVGQYKSAVEPFTRNDMSEQAREANKVVFDDLWQAFKADITSHRALTDAISSGQQAPYMEALRAANGDFAQMAVDNGLVDALKTSEAVRTELINLSGYDKDEESFRGIGFKHYLAATDQDEGFGADNRDQIAVIVARGSIVPGYQKPGMIGGDSTAEQLRDARLNKHTKAVVFRIDSPGGSGFASEKIRQQVLELKRAGIPVVVSMSSVAASGGYWIAADADEIFAAPTTITGSIGVFGVVMTFEDSLAQIGVHSDQVNTTELSGMTTVKALNESQQEMFQLSVESAYEQFINLVANARGMTPAAVHEIAQGRIWTGRQALELGLVDELGGFDDAVAKAAELAAIDSYRLQTYQPELTAREQFIAELFGESASLLGVSPLASDSSPWLLQQLRQVASSADELKTFSDPRAVYAYCTLCPAVQ